MRVVLLARQNAVRTFADKVSKHTYIDTCNCADQASGVPLYWSDLVLWYLNPLVWAAIICVG